MAMWTIYQDIQVLEAALNTAVHVLGLNSQFNTLRARMRNLADNGTVYSYMKCQCSPDVAFDAFEPPADSVCSWSCLLSLLTGLPDPRANLDAFDAFSLRCHRPRSDVTNLEEETDLFMAFTNITKVPTHSISNYVCTRNKTYLIFFR
jgi:hypothetical protein